ncbi:MAG TPA: TA system VapC family ribonuclease toxin [Kofleriaceae bacterium]|nr:TA system VapC family ribonuclease toxin [Kofleriaceae bacterium]
MIAIDTNIIVYARRAELPHHRAARTLLTQLAQGATPWAIPWPCLYEYIKVVTNPRLFRPPDTLADALADVESLVASPSVVLLGHGPEHVRHLRRAADDGHPIGGQIHDAHIVALALEHGVTELLSSDRDFRRFSTLNVRDPFGSSRAGEPRGRYRVRGRRRAAHAQP